MIDIEMYDRGYADGISKGINKGKVQYSSMIKRELVQERNRLKNKGNNNLKLVGIEAALRIIDDVVK